VHSPYWQSGLWLGLVGIGSGMFNSPNTSAMMGTVPINRRGIAAGARTMLQNTGAVISIAFVLAVITAAVPKPVLFKIFSGLAKGLGPAQLDPFIHNMHTALAVLAITSLVGAGVSLLRPSQSEQRRQDETDRRERLADQPLTQREARLPAAQAELEGSLG
jgi:MFS family permease